MEQTEVVLRREIARPAPSVVITEAPCALLPDHRKKKRPVYEVVADLCTGCKACSRLGCPAIEWVHFTPEEAAAAGTKPTPQGMAPVNPILSDGGDPGPPLGKVKGILPRES